MHIWSLRAFICCVTLWGLVVTTYISAAIFRHNMFPAPYNLLIMTTLAVATIVAACAWLASAAEARLEARIARVAERLAADLGALHARLDDWPTARIYPRPVAVGTATVVGADDKLPGYAKGYVDGLARKPMVNDAKVISIDRS